MTITKDIAAKFAVAIVAVSMVLSAFAPVAKAQTTEDLQKMINDLLAQVAALQSQAGQGGSSTAAGVCPYTWTRDLAVGATGADVMKLQQFLNADADTRVAASGAGSVGMETEYFGPATAAAVSKMQVKYRADILSPANLVNPTGYFGASSRAKANSLCVAAPVVTPGDEDATDEDEDEDEDMTLGGEADLATFEVSDGEDEGDVEEGSEDMQIAEFAVEFNNGDAEISRLDVKFDIDGAANTSADNDPWDNLDTVSLWVDGDKVAEMDASDEDEYLDDTADDAVLRFSGLDIVAMEDEEVTIIVAVSVQNNLDGVSDTTDIDVDVEAVAVRYVDADGVYTTEESTDDLRGEDTPAGSVAEFAIEEAGSSEELDLTSSSDEPDATTLKLDEDSNEEYAIFAFELDGDDSDGDIDVNMITVDVAISSTTGSLDAVVNDFRIEIDGESYNAESYVGTGDTAAVNFDIDGDFTVEAGETVTVVVYADFENLDSDSLYQGVTITASVDTTDIDAEGVEEITLGGSDQDGEAQTLRSVGLVADVTSTDTDTQGTNDDTGVFTIVFDLTAYGDDFYVDNTAYETASTGVTFTIEGGTDDSLSATLTSDADESVNGSFFVEEGTTETFTLKVNIGTATAADFRVVLDEVLYGISEAQAINPAAVESSLVVPVEDSRTDYQLVNA